ncbi:hypothetical protein QOZ80_2AG0144430 [Eleusine coracana subsp. coracana]|nr:hypothetical protein QOZ80_2AG0144430 [Eleusine coracana subsp. coracana]
MSSGSTAAAGAAVGGKSARACDSCLRRRARWYCAADDAFLCQACDASVHSANPLARRHDRLRLRLRGPASPPPHESPQALVHAASTSTSTSKQKQQRHRQHVAPAWSRRKARTRSRRPNVKSVGQLLSRKLVVVPEAASSESSEERIKADDEDGAEEEQLLYHRVPSFDGALAELCSPPPVVDASSSCRDDNNAVMENANHHKDPGVVIATSSSSPVQQLPDGGVVAGFGPTDAELREFAADMEALLGQGLDDSAELDESFYMESLGLMTPPAEEDDGGRVKPEPDGAAVSINNRERALGFGHAAETMMKSEASSVEMKATASNGEVADAQFLRRSLDLRLNYEAVIDSWGTSPWTDGQRPEVRLDDFWPHNANHSGLWPAGGGRPCGGGPLLTPRWGADGGREARVSRYREKRRTRLFAKKIRYEVRKLNAEKRPRMKGRFVKRPAAAPCGVT